MASHSQGQVATRGQGKGSEQSNGLSSTERGNRLDTLISFMTENWKEILTDVVTAGVTAYLEHSSRQRSKSESTGTVRTAAKH